MTGIPDEFDTNTLYGTLLALLVLVSPIPIYWLIRVVVDALS